MKVLGPLFEPKRVGEWPRSRRLGKHRPTVPQRAVVRVCMSTNGKEDSEFGVPSSVFPSSLFSRSDQGSSAHVFHSSPQEAPHDELDRKVPCRFDGFDRSGSVDYSDRRARAVRRQCRHPRNARRRRRTHPSLCGSSSRSSRLSPVPFRRARPVSSHRIGADARVLRRRSSARPVACRRDGPLRGR